jgi:hypothetical protein
MNEEIVACHVRICAVADGFLDELRGAMSDKSRALRAKSNEVTRQKTISPSGNGQHGRAGFVARRSQSYGYASSSRLANHIRGVRYGTTHPGMTGH